MTDVERERYRILRRRLLRLAAQCEAISCGYQTAETLELGGEDEARRRLDTELASLADRRAWSQN